MNELQIILPLEEAIQLSAKEDWEHDIKQGQKYGYTVPPWEEVKDTYLSQARIHLDLEGEAFPNYPEHHHIIVEGTYLIRYGVKCPNCNDQDTNTMRSKDMHDNIELELCDVCRNAPNSVT